MKEGNYKGETEKTVNTDIPKINWHLKKYDPSWLDEYKMMRDELVNYMEKLQSVRNMMYLTLGAIFAFSTTLNLPFFCALLPLLFVVPAYLTAVDYWICVRKASAYLVVFHESYEDCPIHWESRHNMLKKMKKKKENFKKSTVKNVALQLSSYYACAIITIIVYALRLINYINISECDSAFDVKIDGISIIWYFAIGVIAVLIMIAFFIIGSRGESYDSFLRKCVIGKCWLNEKFNEKGDRYSLEIQEIIKRYL